MRAHPLRTILLGVLALCAIVGSFFLAEHVANDEGAQALVGRFGYLGMFILAIIAESSFIVPIPAATFTPIFTAAGFPILGIVTTLVIGTLIADGVGYLVGLGGRHAVAHHYPTFQERIQRFARRHHHLVIPGVFLYAALAPFPNEAILIPLALVGIRFRTLFIPLLLGTIILQTALVYGITNVFEYFF